MKIFKNIKKITLEEANALVMKERSGKKLTKKETISILLTRGCSEEEICLILAVSSPDYGKPDKDGIIKTI